MKNISVLLCCLFSLVICIAPAQCNDVLEGEVGGENFTYYRLNRPGNFRIILESLVGDADLYLSDQTLQPDEVNSEIQSISCGIDQAEIPKSFQRPVGIGIYGHPSHTLSKFKISVEPIEIQEDEELSYRAFMDKYFCYPGSDSCNRKPDGTYYTHAESRMDRDLHSEEDETSVLWEILMTIIKIIVEVIL